MKPTGNASADARTQPKPVLPGQTTDRATLAAIAHQAMIERGLEPDFRWRRKKSWQRSAGQPKRQTMCGTLGHRNFDAGRHGGYLMTGDLRWPIHTQPQPPVSGIVGN